MKIVTEIHTSAPADQRWSAIDDDDYDGAPDTPRSGKLMGWGCDIQEAIADLFRLKKEYWEAQHPDEARDREEDEL